MNAVNGLDGKHNVKHNACIYVYIFIPYAKYNIYVEHTDIQSSIDNTFFEIEWTYTDINFSLIFSLKLYFYIFQKDTLNEYNRKEIVGMVKVQIH